MMSQQAVFKVSDQKGSLTVVPGNNYTVGAKIQTQLTSGFLKTEHISSGWIVISTAIFGTEINNFLLSSTFFTKRDSEVKCSWIVDLLEET